MSTSGTLETSRLLSNPHRACGEKWEGATQRVYAYRDHAADHGKYAHRSGRAELEPVSLRPIKVMKKRPQNPCRLCETA